MSIDTAWFATLSVAFGPIMFLRGLRDLRLKRLIENTPTSKIRSLAMGFVEVRGKAEGRSAVNAPFSGRPSVFWAVDVAVASGRKNSWTIVHRECSSRPFFVRDETGLAMIDPRGAQSRFGSEVTEEVAGFLPPEPYRSFLAEHAMYRRWLWTFSRLRFRERSVEEGMDLYVLGTAEPRPQAVNIAEPETELILTGTDGPHASGIGGHDAGFGGLAADPGTGATRLRTERVRSLDKQASAVIRKGRHDSTLIVTVGNEASVTFDLMLKTTLRLLGGPAMTLFGLIYWLVRWS
jgi:hypothetical protein